MGFSLFSFKYFLVTLRICVIYYPNIFHSLFLLLIPNLILIDEITYLERFNNPLKLLRSVMSLGIYLKSLHIFEENMYYADVRCYILHMSFLVFLLNFCIPLLISCVIFLWVIERRCWNLLHNQAVHNDVLIDDEPHI